MFSRIMGYRLSGGGDPCFFNLLSADSVGILYDFLGEPLLGGCSCGNCIASMVYQRLFSVSCFCFFPVCLLFRIEDHTLDQPVRYPVPMVDYGHQ